ncbi:hypothetical protein GWK47_044049 [Chionoecetes opilio]|uniref:Uncharacterized protein n=1 Tax=Chionoecetes opilio TaxID=41210 RepID=A0A8J5CZA8_CHIOP|nr:hypothetical protein GWK47_044049 [Chionoecetes opilio]
MKLSAWLRTDNLCVYVCTPGLCRLRYGSVSDLCRQSVTKLLPLLSHKRANIASKSCHKRANTATESPGGPVRQGRQDWQQRWTTTTVRLCLLTRPCKPVVEWACPVVKTLWSSHRPLRRFMLPLRNTSFSKFLAVRLDHFGLMTSEPMLNSRSTGAEEGTGVLYLMNRSTQICLCSMGKMSGDRGTLSWTSNWVQECKFFSSSSSTSPWDNGLLAAFMYSKVLGRAWTGASLLPLPLWSPTFALISWTILLLMVSSRSGLSLSDFCQERVRFLSMGGSASTACNPVV